MSDFSADGFTAGFASRHEAAAEALVAAFAPVTCDFAPFDLRERARGGVQATGPVHFSPAAPGPKHYAPAEPGHNPTEGWDPFSATVAADDTVFVDQVAIAREAGFAEGRAAALAEVAAAASRDTALLTGLDDALGNRVDREEIAHQLRQTVLFLVTKLVGEVGIAPDVLAKRIGSAADLLADQAESAMLRVHPDDVALLDGKLPKCVFAVGDASMARGSFVLESASTVIEDGPELWLDQLAEAIERVAVPVASC